MKILAILAGAIPLLAADSFVIRNVHIHPVAGPAIPGGSILIDDGRIAEVAGKVAAPKGTRIVDGKGLHAYPGMIDSATELGLGEISSIREASDTHELGDFNPQLRAIVAVNPASEHIPVVRANGITSAIALPYSSGGRSAGAPSGILTGQPALIHLDGWTWEDMAVKRSTAIELVFPVIVTGGTPRVSYVEGKRAYDKRIRELNSFFDDARRYQTSKAGGASGFRTDLKYEAMLPVLDGTTPLLITAARELAIQSAIDFAGKQKIKVILAGCREFGKTLGSIKAANIPVILGPTLALPLREDEPYDAPATLPAELFKAGVKFAFGTFGNQFSRNLPYQAATAVAYGLPYEEALKAVTLNAAEIWGVAGEVGSLEKGKWADLMLTDGDPLETSTQVKQLYIKGKLVDLTNKHTRLYEKYLNRP